MDERQGPLCRLPATWRCTVVLRDVLRELDTALAEHHRAAAGRGPAHATPGTATVTVDLTPGAADRGAGPAPDPAPAPETPTPLAPPDDPAVYLDRGGLPAFFAGVPLVVDDETVGTLCLLDSTPRPFSRAEVTRLEQFGGQLSALLELRRRETTVRRERDEVRVELGHARQAASLLEAVTTHFTGPIYARDLDGRFLLANPSTCGVFGREPGDVLGHTLFDVLPRETAQALHRNDQEMLRAKEPRTFTEDVPQPDGAVHRYHSTKFPLLVDGQVWGAGGVSVDLSAQLTMRRQLEESERRFRSLGERATAGVVITDDQGRVQWANPAAVRMLGRPSPDALAGEDLREAIPGLDLPLAGQDAEPERVRRLRLPASTTGDPGPLVDVRVFGTLGDDDRSHVIEFLDVSERVAQEETLNRSTRRLTALFEQAPVGYLEAGLDGRIIAVNHRLAEMLEEAPTVWDQRPLEELVVPAERTELRRRILAVADGTGRRLDGEWHARTRDGSHVPVTLQLQRLTGPDGAPDRLGAVVIDQSAAVRAREALAEQKERLSALLRSVPDAVVIVDPDGTIVEVNDTAEHMFGRPPGDLAGRQVQSLVPDAWEGGGLDARDPSAAPSAPFRVSTDQGLRGVRPDGQTFPVEVAQSSVDLPGGRAVIVSIRDVSVTARMRRALEEAHEQLQGVLSAATEQAIISTDLDGAITLFNSGAEKLTGLDSTEVIGHPLDSLYDGGQAEAFFDELGLVERGEAGWEAVAGALRTSTPRAWRIRTRTGAVREVLQTLTVRRRANRPVGYIVVAQDMTEHLRDQRELALSEQRFRSAFDNAPIGMALISFQRGQSGRFLLVNTALCQITGYTEAELLATDVLSITSPDDVPGSRQTAERLLRGETETVRQEKRYRHAEGHDVWVDVSVSLVRDERGRPLYAIAQMEDITARRAAEAELTRAALHDPLTGLGNRLMLVDRIEHALARQQREGHAIAVLYLDLDNFKMVNDLLGHAAGDRVLVEAAERLQVGLRECDSAVRIGGDEFAVVCEDLAAIEDAVTVARRIEDALSITLPADGRDIVVSASVGVRYHDGGQVSADTLLRDADSAMYRAKNNGRARYELADTGVGHQLRLHRQLALEGDLREALLDQPPAADPPDDREGLRLAYQPCVELSTGRVIAVEALARWNHPTHGLLSPADFLELADHRGLLQPLGVWVVEAALRQARSWHAEPDGDAPEIWINVHPTQLGRHDLAGYLRAGLERHALPAAAVGIELSEPLLDGVSDAVADDLARIRDLGVRITIDNCGTGRSTLEYLHRLPFTTLKIDRSVIGRLIDGPTATGIAAGIVAMGRSLDLDVVAQGVETAAELARLREIGCPLGQGHFLQPPGTAREIGVRLQNRPRQAGRNGALPGIPAVRRP